jgi:hypothetical protein
MFNDFFTQVPYFHDFFPQNRGLFRGRCYAHAAACGDGAQRQISDQSLQPSHAKYPSFDGKNHRKTVGKVQQIWEKNPVAQPWRLSFVGKSMETMPEVDLSQPVIDSV